MDARTQADKQGKDREADLLGAIADVQGTLTRQPSDIAKDIVSELRAPAAEGKKN